MQRFQESLIGNVLDQIPVGAGREGGREPFVAHGLRQHDEPCLRHGGAQHRHIAVEVFRPGRRIDQDQGRLSARAPIGRPGGIGRFPDDFKPGLGQKLLQSLAKQLVRIDEVGCDGLLH